MKQSLLVLALSLAASSAFAANSDISQGPLQGNAQWEAQIKERIARLNAEQRKQALWMRAQAAQPAMAVQQRIAPASQRSANQNPIAMQISAQPSVPASAPSAQQGSATAQSVSSSPQVNQQAAPATVTARVTSQQIPTQQATPTTQTVVAPVSSPVDQKAVATDNAGQQETPPQAWKDKQVWKDRQTHMQWEAQRKAWMAEQRAEQQASPTNNDPATLAQPQPQASTAPAVDQKAADAARILLLSHTTLTQQASPLTPAERQAWMDRQAHMQLEAQMKARMAEQALQRAGQ